MKMRRMNNKKPDTSGYDEDGNCPQCRSAYHEDGPLYRVGDTTYQDTYCMNCGTVLETQEII